MRNRKGIPKVALVSKPPRVVVLSYVSNRKLSIITVVGHREATDNLLLEIEAISLGSIRKTNHRGLIIAYLSCPQG